MEVLDFKCSDVGIWKEALSSYESRIESLNKPDLVSLDQFYRIKLPCLLHDRDPNPYLTTSELCQLMKWKLTRGKWRPRLLDFVSSLDDSVVKSASEKAFKSLPDISKAVKELTVLKGVGPATASAVLAAYAPDIAPFMSDEELKLKGEWDGPSDIERALWSCTVGAKSQPEKSSSGKKRKR
ncbi:uncharacterized protein LOC17891074 isoform X2 [Capsella rubella]|uniref:uncharacterized protein LOC17891074 isoform X2 n=1 Tax=Capsella rubella TaxID=81985 RepID=UPI000CD4BF20|nr:uncharacterized protein LOC17891074 isoform X2 [Capsella rubella]